VIEDHGVIEKHAVIEETPRSREEELSNDAWQFKSARWTNNEFHIMKKHRRKWHDGRLKNGG
jgi:hypothetical protein